jgi:thiamine kinase-like enzyme
VEFPPVLSLTEAKAASQTGDPLRAFAAVKEVLKKASRDSDLYREALALYSRYSGNPAVLTQKEKEERDRQQADANATAEAKKKESLTRCEAMQQEFASKVDEYTQSAKEMTDQSSSCNMLCGKAYHDEHDRLMARYIRVGKEAKTLEARYEQCYREFNDRYPAG